MSELRSFHKTHCIVCILLRTVWLDILRSCKVVREYAYAVFVHFLCNGRARPLNYEVPVQHLLRFTVLLLRLPATLLWFCLQPLWCICKILKYCLLCRRNDPLKPVGELFSCLVIFIHFVLYLLPFLLPYSFPVPIVLFVLSPSSFLTVIGIWDVTKIRGSFCHP